MKTISEPLRQASKSLRAPFLAQAFCRSSGNRWVMQHYATSYTTATDPLSATCLERRLHRVRVDATGALRYQDGTAWSTWSTIATGLVPSSDCALCEWDGGLRVFYWKPDGGNVRLWSREKWEAWEGEQDTGISLADTVAPHHLAVSAHVASGAQARVIVARAPGTPWTRYAFAPGVAAPQTTASLPALPSHAATTGVATACDAGLVHHIVVCLDGKVYGLTWLDGAGSYASGPEAWWPGAHAAPAAGGAVGWPAIVIAEGIAHVSWVDSLTAAGSTSTVRIAARVHEWPIVSEPVTILCLDVNAGRAPVCYEPGIDDGGRVLLSDRFMIHALTIAGLAAGFELGPVPAYEYRVAPDGSYLRVMDLHVLGRRLDEWLDCGSGDGYPIGVEIRLERGYRVADGTVEYVSTPWHRIASVEVVRGREVIHELGPGHRIVAVAGDALWWAQWMRPHVMHEWRAITYLGLLRRLLAQSGARAELLTADLGSVAALSRWHPGETLGGALLSVLRFSALAAWTAESGMVRLAGLYDYAPSWVDVGDLDEILRLRLGVSRGDGTSARVWGEGVASTIMMGAGGGSTGLESWSHLADARIADGTAAMVALAERWTWLRMSTATGRVAVRPRLELELYDRVRLLGELVGQVLPTADRIRRVLGIEERYHAAEGVCEQVLHLGAG